MNRLMLRFRARGLSLDWLKTALHSLHAFMGKSLARRLVLGLFVVQAVVLVFAVHITVPPDEQNNIDFIQYYANHSVTPFLTNQAPTYSLGDKTREVDYLYHYAMSLVERVLPFSEVTEDRIVRLFSVAFAVVTFMVLARVLKRLRISEAVISSSLLIITNLPMVLLLSAAINNDVLVWLGLALGLLLILRLAEDPLPTDVLWLLALCCLGGLAKRTLLPVCVVFGVSGLIIVGRYWRILLDRLRSPKRYFIVALLVAVIGAGLFVERIGGNVVHYKSVQVSCEQVDGPAACDVFWTNVRAHTLAELPPEKPLPFPFFVVRWFSDTFYNIVDIQTQYWKHQVRPARLLTPVLAAVFVIGLGYGVLYEKERFAAVAESRYRVYVTAVALIYIGVQLAVNFSTYRHYKVYGIALNGRYIIPSLLPLVGLVGFYWSKMLRRHPAPLIMLTVMLIVLTIGGSGLLMMLRNSQLYYGS
ncbi:MAG TPA: hypothetical protein VLG92_05545 [Candidatus Saccharimonadia bacterium]|nr:hypothetical protein [Candidatus Saccharimonadia bacterium]